jgi:hypothetical protein
MPGQTRLAPAPISGDAVAQLCLVAEELQKNQQEIPLLRDAVGANTERMDKLLPMLADLVRATQDLRAAVQENTEAILSGKGSLDQHRAELERSHAGSGAKP